MKTPKQVAIELEDSGCVFTAQQAESIAALIYQPLKNEIEDLKKRLDDLSKKFY